MSAIAIPLALTTARAEVKLRINMVVAAVCLLSIVVIAAIVALRILVPSDTTTFVLILGFVASTVGTLLALVKIQETHTTFNSKMDELLRVSKELARSEGRAEGRSEGRSEGWAKE